MTATKRISSGEIISFHNRVYSLKRNVISCADSGKQQQDHAYRDRQFPDQQRYGKNDCGNDEANEQNAV